MCVFKAGCLLIVDARHTHDKIERVNYEDMVVMGSGDLNS